MSEGDTKSELSIHIGSKPSDTYLCIGDHTIGFVQEIKFSAKSDETICFLEVVFPSLYLVDDSIVKQIQSDVALLTKIPCVKISFSPHYTTSLTKTTQKVWESTEFEKQLLTINNK